MDTVKEELIAAMSSPEEIARKGAARQIYALGCALADQAVRRWRQNEDFTRLTGKQPEVTVGLAVRPETFAKIREANGWPQLAEVPAEQDASEFTLRFEDGVTLDVLTSRKPEGSGAIAKFLAKMGEGVQQVEFGCSDVDRAAAILRNDFGVSPVYPAARPGADGTRVNFFLAEISGHQKVLIELYEPADVRFD
jgi:hypothetical protein